ncbi:uncharacterized protein TNCV_14441 [Trichonephila clavipes]|nr:uncharacterized protein TNCV_14441 [Trichonephila clavipes]
MAPGSGYMSDNTCGSRRSWTNRWAVMVPRINTRFPRARYHCKRRRRWVDVKGSKRNGRRYLKCPSARCLRMVRESTWAPIEGATCAWIAADEAVVCMRAFLMMWRSSRRLVCQEHPEPGLHVNDIYQIHWSQHLLTTQT